MATREIELILKLRKQINKSQLTDIREQLRSITKALDDSQFSKRYIEWTRKAGKATTVFRGKINQLIIRVEVLRRRMESLAGIEPLGNIGKNIEKLSETTRRVTKEFGGLARESIPKMDKLSSSLKKTTDSANAFSDIVGEKLPPFVRSFTGEIESNRAALEMMNRDSQRAFNGLEMLGTGAESIVPHVHAATGSIAQMSLAMTQAVPQAKALEQTLSSLEIKLLKFKAIGSLTGMLDFEKSLRGLRVFREELEKLRFDFARVFQEKPTFAGGGVTDKMISNFIKLRESMDLLKVKAEQTFPNIKAHIDSLRATKSEFDSLRASIQESTGAFVPNLQQITFHKAKLKELEPTIEAVAQKYVSLRTKLIGAFRDIGVELNKAAMYPGSFASALKRSEGESLASMQALATGVKKIEQSYEETIKRTEMNLRKFARTNAQTFEQASFDQEANLRWLEKTEMAMLELDKIYRDFAVAAAKGGQGFLATKQGAEQANAVIAKAIELEERLTGTQKRRAASIRMNVESQRVQKTVTDQVVAIEQNLAETLARVNAEQSALAITNTKLSESEIFLSKRIANLRAKSEALITSIIQLTACLRALDPTSKKDAAQIAKLSARLEVLQKEAIVTTSSMERLERQMRKGADASRAMDRVSAKGFANMITSQAAWMAGFQMIFGSLDKIKAAFMSLVSLQNALVRAMRTARSDIQGYSEIWESYEKAMVRARVRTGTEMEELGEILFQLGSSGLTAEEAVAALDSTLNNLIGTEADVKNITKLIAGLYNNFADQIVKVNGQIVSVSATTEDLGNATREAASQTEKFAFINDLLVATFRDNQVEMNEMRDGLKLMASLLVRRIYH